MDNRNRYFAFQAMCEPTCHGPMQAGLVEEVLVPGRDYMDAERVARVVLGDRYRGATTNPPTACGVLFLTDSDATRLQVSAV